jgi:hypothetical protein
MEIVVTAQGGKLGPDFPAELAAIPAIDYSALLRTSRERFEEDLEAFRSVLSRTRIREVKVSHGSPNAVEPAAPKP